MSTKTLILTRDFSPHKVVPWNRAVMMLFQGKIRVVEEYMSDEHLVGVIEPKRHRDFAKVLNALGTRAQPGCDVPIYIPSVASLINSTGSFKRGVKFSRINVFTRDNFRCQYCGETKKMTAINYDHVVPRSQGGKTVWNNIVTACYPCNSRKGNRTPVQAGMKLLKAPYTPKVLPMTGPRFDAKDIPVAWLPYVVTFIDGLEMSSAVA
jgi:HNH endonuclease